MSEEDIIYEEFEVVEGTLVHRIVYKGEITEIEIDGRIESN